MMLLGIVLSGTADAQGRTARCTRANAPITTIQAVQAAISEWEGRCVRMRGIGTTRRLYSHRMALLERIDTGGRLPLQSIVIYPEGPGAAERWPRLVEIIGRIDNCATHHAVVAARYAGRTDVIAWVSGYCHTSLESFIRPVSIRTLSSSPVLRLTEAEVPAEQRPLIEAPTDLPGRNANLAVARSLVAAINARDEPAFLRLYDPAGTSEVERLSGGPLPAWVQRNRREGREALAALLRSNSVFARLGGPNEERQRVFVERSELRTDGEVEDNTPYSYLTCFCRTANCAGRWPVRVQDADNDPSRPYACVRTGDYLIFRQGTRPYASADQTGYGFAEPSWPRD